MVPRGPSRRYFLRTTAATAASTLAGLRRSFAASSPAVAQSELTPEAALKELTDGNRRYVTGRLAAHEHDLQQFPTKSAEKQQPFAAVLSCADSRVPVELVFDQTIGQVFVCRIAGNVTTPEVIASLEYGASVLGVKAILVLGHSHCGAVSATTAGAAVPGQISALYPRIRPAVDQSGPDLEATTKTNAKIHAALLREASPVIAGLMKENKVKVVAGYYDVANGQLALLE